MNEVRDRGETLQQRDHGIFKLHMGKKQAMFNEKSTLCHQYGHEL